MLVFAHHTTLLDGIERALVNKFGKETVVRIDGKSGSGAKRQKSVDTFQNNSKCRVAVLGITSAGEVLSTKNNYQ